MNKNTIENTWFRDQNINKKTIKNMCEILIDTANTIKTRLNNNLYIDFNYHAQELNFIMQAFKSMNYINFIFEDVNKFNKGA